MFAGASSWCSRMLLREEGEPFFLWSSCPGLCTWGYTGALGPLLLELMVFMATVGLLSLAGSFIVGKQTPGQEGPLVCDDNGAEDSLVRGT